jgi:hypothetical protein
VVTSTINRVELNNMSHVWSILGKVGPTFQKVISSLRVMGFYPPVNQASAVEYNRVAEYYLGLVYQDNVPTSDSSPENPIRSGIIV